MAGWAGWLARISKKLPLLLSLLRECRRTAHVYASLTPSLWHLPKHLYLCLCSQCLFVFAGLGEMLMPRLVHIWGIWKLHLRTDGPLDRESRGAALHPEGSPVYDM